jgi:MFS transporter, DHA2 family, multidrug resistance protein
LPFGLLASAGLSLFLLDEPHKGESRFDWIGFAVLSLGIGAFQIMLDRGELKGWFGATEIIIEATLAGLGVYLFIVNTMLAEQPFIPPRIFRDLNFSAGLLVMFAIGLVLLASATLLAPYLQSLGGYPVEQAGLLMAPRGVGTMIAMMMAGRIDRRLDQRLMMLFGFAMIAESLREMTGWTPDVDAWTLTRTTLLQGAGLGFVFIPLQVIAFATLPVELRTDGTALFSLVRNVGSSVGISITSALLAQNTQVLHAQIAAHVTPFSRMLQTGGAYLLWNSVTPAGLGALNTEVTRQASIIAYIDDFKFMLLVCVPAAAWLLLMRRPPPLPAAADHPVIHSAQPPAQLRHASV